MRSSLRLLTAALVVGACVATAGINVSAANAYPSWDDVQNAKNNEAAKTTQMAELQGYITTIQSELDVVTEKAQAAGELYSAAVTKFDEADVRYNQLMAYHWIYFLCSIYGYWQVNGRLHNQIIFDTKYFNLKWYIN